MSQNSSTSPTLCDRATSPSITGDVKEQKISEINEIQNFLMDSDASSEEDDIITKKIVKPIYQKMTNSRSNPNLLNQVPPEEDEKSI